MHNLVFIGIAAKSSNKKIWKWNKIKRKSNPILTFNNIEHLFQIKLANSMLTVQLCCLLLLLSFFPSYLPEHMICEPIPLVYRAEIVVFYILHGEQIHRHTLVRLRCARWNVVNYRVKSATHSHTWVCSAAVCGQYFIVWRSVSLTPSHAIEQVRQRACVSTLIRSVGGCMCVRSQLLCVEQQQ